MRRRIEPDSRSWINAVSRTFTRANSFQELRGRFLANSAEIILLKTTNPDLTTLVGSAQRADSRSPCVSPKRRKSRCVASTA